MNPTLSAKRSADAALLIRTGACLFGLSLINGFAIEATPIPRLALSAHLVGLMGATFLFALGGIWSRLTFRPHTSRVAALCRVNHQVLAILSKG